MDSITSHLSFSCDESRKEEDEEIQEAAESLPAAKEISRDAAIAVVLSGLDAIFDNENNKKMALEAFHNGPVLALVLTGFCKSL